MQSYTLKFNFQIKFYFFIENLCFCSLKIAVCVLKITIISKNCRLKITAISKNYGLKIPVRACVCICAYVCAYVCACSHPDTRPRPAHDRNTSAGKGRNTGKPAYIGMIADDEKKYKKKLKKIWN